MSENIKALDYMIKYNLHKYNCDPWRRKPDDDNYNSCKGVSGQINYRGEIFVLFRSPGSSGSLTDMATPPLLQIIKVKK